jgi:hypothetical protein
MNNKLHTETQKIKITKIEDMLQINKPCLKNTEQWKLEWTERLWAHNWKIQYNRWEKEENSKSCMLQYRGVNEEVISTLEIKCMDDIEQLETADR